MDNKFEFSSENVRFYLIITILLGFFGIHWFIRGNNKKGILYLFTLGIFLIGWIIDIGEAIRMYLIYRSKHINIEKPEHNFINKIKLFNIKTVNNGIDFEKYICDILIKNGYTANVTQASNDYGVDVLAEKDMVKYAIQCKYYSGSVGISSVQEVITGKQYYNCHIAVVATNSYFTKNAIELAKANNVLLWDGNYIELLNKGE